MEVCAGASTASLALQYLIGQSWVHLVGAYDVDPKLRRFACRVHDAAEHHSYHFGQSDGNILRLDPKRMMTTDVLVAGPPCPPFSRLGSRKSFEDSRAAVFWKVVDIIADQANRGIMVFFILENVEGFCQKPQGAVSSPLQVVLAELRDVLPKGWVLEWRVLNSLDFGLPQSRKRVYITGRYDHPGDGEHLMRLQRFRHPPTLGSLIDASDTVSKQYTAIQNRNVADWKDKLQTSMMDVGRRGQYAAVDYSRTPSGRTAWGGSAVPDRCECLTASGPSLHVFALGYGRGQLPLDRCLRPAERAALQGFPVSWARLLDSEIDAKRIFGNAMSVPVLGSVLASLLTWWKRTVLDLPMYPSIDAPWLPGPCFIVEDSAAQVPEGQSPLAVPGQSVEENEDSSLESDVVHPC